jgi:hypothetical protein
MKHSAFLVLAVLLPLLWQLDAKPAAEARPASEIVRSVMTAEDALNDIPLREVIAAATGHHVLVMNPEKSAADAACRAHVSAGADRILAFLNAPGNPAGGLRRINEASRAVEGKLMELLNAGAFTCTRARTAAGAEQHSGYPDLRLVHRPTGRVYFLDPKLFESGSAQSTLRTFYYEPKALTGKIHEDACHLLLGISHDGNDGAWKFTGWRLIDLYQFRVRLKAEFQASNKDLYRDELTLGSSK